jgi:hypothetical protein
MPRTVLAALLIASGAAAQDKKPDPPQAPAVDESKVDAAIKKGIAYLRTAPSPGAHAGIKDSDELILWTYVHSGIGEDDPDFQKYWKKMLEGPLEKTYKVALQAMILEELDRVKFQERIAQCAQFLVDNQCVNGQWSYGNPSEFVKDVKVPEPSRSTATPSKSGAKDFSAPGERVKPKIVQHVPVKKMKDGPATGDNSNTQYAALGLRACFDAGIMIPEPTILQAVKWWRESQFADAPKTDKDGKPAVASGGSGKMEGWNYKDPAAQADKPPYSAMTAGGTSALVIYDYMLDRRWKEDTHVKSGVNWLVQHFAVNTNYYYMYGLERTGILFGAEKFGAHDWYAEGAAVLLKAQNADGSWGRAPGAKPEDKGKLTHDTCFAILFLRRATRPLVATEGGGKLKK